MTSPSLKKMTRKMGLLSDQEGIIIRYLREKEHWQSHLERTRKFIEGSFQGEKYGIIAVLGSGWLLDVPWETLSERFEKVLLVDLHHPVQVRKKVEHLSNIIFEEVDITGGGIEFTWNLINGKSNHHPIDLHRDFLPSVPNLCEEPDLLISVNILNQLDILLVDFLKANRKDLEEHQLNIFRKQVQQFHLDWITRKPGCIITDIAEINVDKKDQRFTRQLMHVEMPEYKRKESWIWDFDMSGYYYRDMQTRMEVEALEW